MYSLLYLVILRLFMIHILENQNSPYITHAVHLKGSLLPRSFRNASHSMHARRYPSMVKIRTPYVLLLLCGDIALNHGPIYMGVIYCRSNRNKGPIIADTVCSHKLDILVLIKTHVRPTDSWFPDRANPTK